MYDPIIVNFKTERDADEYIAFHMTCSFGLISKTYYPHEDIWRVEVL